MDGIMQTHRVLDHGYVTLVEAWGSDERIIESARMSTNKGFKGWGPFPCPACAEWASETVRVGQGWLGDGKGEPATIHVACSKCHGTKTIPGDEGLLSHLWTHKHATPFEMAGLTLEIQAPIFVFREWMRHRTQSYSEMSARYTPIPNVNYLPTIERLMMPAGSNKQAQGTGATLTLDHATDFLHILDARYAAAEELYQTALEAGVPKELARLILPVGRYSRMRASANLRNWLGFLTLRMDTSAQWEIRQYANIIGTIIAHLYPRTWSLFIAGDSHAS